MISPYDTHLTLECQRNGQYSDVIILQMDCHICGAPRASFENFTRGNLKVELCQSDRSLQQVWRFLSAIFRGDMQGHYGDIWDKIFLIFALNQLIPM
jgi:hypothetical protein